MVGYQDHPAKLDVLICCAGAFYSRGSSFVVSRHMGWLLKYSSSPPQKPPTAHPNPHNNYQASNGYASRLTLFVVSRHMGWLSTVVYVGFPSNLLRELLSESEGAYSSVVGIRTAEEVRILNLLFS